MKTFRVDLRSDTVTQPSEAMRRAMAEAEVGDDWYGDDPTVNRLQERAAETMSMEAGMFLPTGTMGNQIGLRLHCTANGHLVAAEASSHVASTELMTSAVLAGISYRTVRAPRGWLTTELVRGLLEPDVFYDVEMVDLLAVQNTAGAGGTVLPVDELRQIRKLAEEAGVPIHLDGARIFNAAAAAEVDVSEWTREVDTMMFCVSKGLGAPVGSILCGPQALMPEARRLKILYGGAWRQAGVLAAAGLVALEEGPGRLHEDHVRARRLAEGLAELAPGSVDLEMVETNMVFVDTSVMGLEPFEAAQRLAEEGVGCTISPPKVRMVTHVDVSDPDVETALAAWRTISPAAR
ncbi:MAG: beta-eliminating lyase-related protein [Actinobacteria bacterium]|nr:beta-eliminating lyase-related protein [Actinomycetota bacterium]